MCNKKHKYSAERLIEMQFALHGGHDNVQTLIQIEYISGFELFNYTPYHCYETWCQGWRVTYKDRVVQRECLVCALEEVLEKK